MTDSYRRSESMRNDSLEQERQPIRASHSFANGDHINHGIGISPAANGEHRVLQQMHGNGHGHRPEAWGNGTSHNGTHGPNGNSRMEEINGQHKHLNGNGYENGGSKVNGANVDRLQQIDFEPHHGGKEILSHNLSAGVHGAKPAPSQRRTIGPIVTSDQDLFHDASPGQSPMAAKGMSPAGSRGGNGKKGGALLPPPQAMATDQTGDFESSGSSKPSTATSSQPASKDALLKARKRLAELEERLSFIGSLEKTVSTLNQLSHSAEVYGEKEARNSPIRSESRLPNGQTSVEWQLPNAVNDEPYLAMQKGYREGIGQAGLAEVKNEKKFDAYEDEKQGAHRLQSSPEGASMAPYQRPSSEMSNGLAYKDPKDIITLGMTLTELRQIVREETVEKDSHNKKRRSSLTLGEPVERVMHLNEQGEMVFAPSEQDSEEDHTKQPEHQRRKLNRDLIPKTLEEAVPVSCPLIFGGLSRQSPVRMKCFEIATKGSWATFFLLVTLANSLYIAVSPAVQEDSAANTEFSAAVLFDYFCVAVFYFEILCFVAAFGFASSETTWLQNSDFHKMDFAVAVVTTAEYTAAAFGIRGVTLRPFRLLRVFKAMIKVKAFSSVKAIIATLKQGLGQLTIVFSMLLFFVATFGILGMALFSRAFSRRCVYANRPVPACSTDMDGGWASSCDFREANETMIQSDVALARPLGYPHYMGCKIIANLTPGRYDGEWPLDEFGNYHTCQWEEFRRAGGDNSVVTQYCVEYGNPQFTFQHFDHMGGALLSVFQVAAPDGAYDVIWATSMGEPMYKPGVWTYYLLISALCTWLLLGLFVAVVTGTFKRVREGYGLVFSSDDDEDKKDKNQDEDNSILAQFAAELEKKKNPDAAGDSAYKNKPMMASMMAARRSFIPSLPKRRSEQDEEDGGTVIQAAAYHLLFGNRLRHFVAAWIFLHCASMAAQLDDDYADYHAAAAVLELLAQLVFASEVCLRFVAYGGLGEFWKSRFNRLELFLVFVAFVGVAMNIRFLMLLGSVRLYRLMRYFPTLHSLLHSAVASTRSIVNLVIFIGIVALCFAVAGRYVFQDLMTTTRSNFATFGQAMLTIFQLLTGDSWSAVVYHAMHAKTTEYGRTFAAMFVMTWFIFSKLVVTNLFVAVIIENFEVAETIDNIKKPGMVSGIRGFLKKSYENTYRMQQANRTDVVTYDTSTETYVAKKGLSYHLTQQANEENLSRNMGLGIAVNSHVAALVASTVKDKIKKASEEEQPERVLYYFYPNHPVRKWFIWIGEQPMFDVMIYLAIVVGCMFLVLTPPAEDLPDHEPLISFETMNQWNFVFTLVFTVEFTTRTMQHGLIRTKNAYLKSGWNIIDTVVLLFAWVDETGLISGGNIAKVLRLARALRPLRLMKRNQGMRVVIDALISTLAPVAYVLVFSLFTMLVFCILGMGLFGGFMHRCSDGAEYPAEKSDCSGYHVRYPDAYMVPRSWKPPTHNFDTFGSAMLTLFRVNTIKYVAIMNDAMDITYENMNPKVNFRVGNSLFFVAYLIVGALFVMNLFVGFIVDGFNANKGSSEAELQFNRFQRGVAENKPKYERFKPPNNQLSDSLRSMVVSNYFETFSMSCVIINVIFMMSEHVNMDPGFQRVFDTQNEVFVYELWVENFLYLIGFGPGGFINDPWKAFDLFVGMGAMVGVVSNNPRYSQFTRCFRLLRMIRLMKMIKPIRVILETLISSIPQLLNVILLLVLVYSMFAVFAVQVFGTTKYGDRLGPTANFENWTDGILTIYQMITGDEWMLLMDDCSVQPPYCTERFSIDVDPYYEGKEYSFGDCGSSFAPYFFLTFMIVCESIMLNLFVGMILDNFSFITDQVAEVEDDDWATGATSTQIKELSLTFQNHDSGTGYCALSGLHGLMKEMAQPLGFRTRYNEIQYGRLERTAEQLIRAELNCAIRTRREDAAKMKPQNIFSCTMPKFLNFAPPYKFNAAVSFEELMMTALYWRKPAMVPDGIKGARKDTVREIVLMSQALIIKDFLLKPISERHHKEVNRALVKHRDFSKWAVTDEHFARRKGAMSKLSLKHKRRAQRNPVYRNQFPQPPAKVQTVELKLLEFPPENMVDHDTMVRSGQQVKFPKPTNGVLGFLAQSATQKVVMQFVDSRNAKTGYVMGDFTSIEWTGWISQDFINDAVYWPRIKKEKAGDEPVLWNRVDFKMKPKIAFAGQGREAKLVGSLLDLQGFITFQEMNEVGKPTDPRSQCRLNIGAFAEEIEPGYMATESQKLWMSLEELEDCRNCVLQVVGYVPAEAYEASA